MLYFAIRLGKMCIFQLILGLNCPMMDFGDSCSSLVIRILQEKYLSQMCQLRLTKHIIIHGGYVDNYSGSFKIRKIVHASERGHGSYTPKAWSSTEEPLYISKHRLVADKRTYGLAVGHLLSRKSKV